MALNLTWRKCVGGIWCGFQALDLNNVTFENARGVYIIWSNKIVVYVGSGNIKERITQHRLNNEITAYPNLKVTWAEVNEGDLLGVEKFLIETLKPIITENAPDVAPTEVNYPWW